MNGAARAACEIAMRYGLRVDRPTILSDRSNLIIHLQPSRVVARVATNTTLARRGDEWLRREVMVASHLARAGARVVPPAARLPPGPHESNGFFVTFWEQIEQLGEPPDPIAAGRALRECHDALQTFSEPLPAWAPIAESERVLSWLKRSQAISPRDCALLESTLARHRFDADEIRSPVRPLHGNAHLGNVLSTRDGPVWNDWEDTFAGPLSWDLACLVARSRISGKQAEPSQAALAAHGFAVDPDELDSMIELRAVYVSVWSAAIAARQGRVLDELSARFEWLRGRKA